MSHSFNVGDIPSLAGKVIVVTGGTAGLGEQTVTELARHEPAKVLFTGRNQGRAEEVIRKMRANPGTSPATEVAFVECDQTSLASCRRATADIEKTTSGRVDILICNAGVMAIAPGVTADGYEIQFGTNYLAHAALVKGLLPALLRTAKAHGDARLVVLTSTSMRFASSIPFHKLQSDCSDVNTWVRYGTSKVSNILYGAEVARRYPAISVAVVHPGLVATNLLNNIRLLNKVLVYATTIGRRVQPEEGIRNTMWAATAARSQFESGAFYEPVGKPGNHSACSKNAGLGTELWNWTEQQLA